MTVMKPVKSSSIEAVGHDPVKKALIVQFKNGGTYRYDDVSAEHHQKLMDADSIGTHFQQHIRAKFNGVKV